MRHNDLLCEDCEFLLKTPIHICKLVKMTCSKYDVTLEQRDYQADAYRCYLCRNGEDNGKRRGRHSR